MKKLFATFIIVLISNIFAQNPMSLRIADATTKGDASIKYLLLKMSVDEPEKEFSIERTSLIDAIKLLQENKVDMVLLEDTKNIKKVDNTTLQPYAVGALVFYTNTKNNLKNLTSKQAIDILNAPVISWKDFTGDKQDIHRIRLNDLASGGYFTKVIFGNKYKDNMLGFFELSSVEEMLLLIQGNSNAIGFAPFIEGVPITVQLLKYENIDATLDNILTGKYPLTLNRYVLYGNHPMAKELLKRMSSVEFADALISENMISTAQ